MTIMFCKYCGQSIPSDSLFCEGCGERIKGEINQTAIKIKPLVKIRNSHTIAVWILAIIILALIVLCGMQYKIGKEANDSFIKLQNDYKTLETIYLSTNRELTEANRASQSFFLEKAFLENEVSQLKAKLVFMETAAVVVTPTGSRYHCVDCFHIRNSGLGNTTIYLRDDAELLGYVPCLDCREGPGVPKRNMTQGDLDALTDLMS